LAGTTAASAEDTADDEAAETLGTAEPFSIEPTAAAAEVTETTVVEENVAAPEEPTVTEPAAGEEESAVAEANAAVTGETTVTEPADGEEETAVAEDNTAVTEEPSETETPVAAEVTDAPTGEDTAAEDSAMVDAVEPTGAEASDLTTESAAEPDDAMTSSDEDMTDEGENTAVADEDTTDDEGNLDAGGTSNTGSVRRRATSTTTNYFAVGSADSQYKYTTLKEAVDAAADGSTIYVINKCKSDSTLTAGSKNFTLDLNGIDGFSLSIDGTYSGKITVQDASISSGWSNLYVRSGSLSDIEISARARCYFSGNLLSGDSTTCNAESFKDASITISGGCFVVSDYNAKFTKPISVTGGIVSFYRGTYGDKITVSGGKVEFGRISDNATTFPSVLVTGSGMATLSNGTFNEVIISGEGSLEFNENGYKGIMIEKLSAINEEDNQQINTIPVTIKKKKIRFISENQPISLKQYEDSKNKYMSVTAGTAEGKTCVGWYLGTGVADGDTANLKLCNRATYMFAALDCHEGDTYYASYAETGTDTETTDQMSITTDQKDTSTIHLELKRTIPEAYTVTLVGIKYSTNKVLQSNLTDKKANTVDLTGEADWGADEITKTMLFGTEGTSYRKNSVEKSEGLGNSVTSYLNLKVGDSNTGSWVYALGYATVTDGSNQYTIYTGLYAVTYNNAANTPTAK
jgi:hypothetical protein